MGDLYHKAARDSVLELLKTATKRDANRRDEDGMSPVHYAASCGNVEALRLLVGKGLIIIHYYTRKQRKIKFEPRKKLNYNIYIGEPDRPNHEGATAVHLAASCGQLNCLSFLTSFGSSIWALDNEGRTPLEEAALHGHMDCVRHLDGLIAIQMTRNKKDIERCKRRAKKDMMNRLRKQEKMMQSREYAYEKKVAKETKRKSQSDPNRTKMIWNANNGTSGRPFSELTSLNRDLDQNEISPNKMSKSHSTDTFQFGSSRFKMLGILRNRFSSLQSRPGSEPKMIHRKSLGEAGLFSSLSKSNPSLLDQLESRVVENQHHSFGPDPFDDVDESDLSFGHMVRKLDDKGNVVTQVHYVPKASPRIKNGSVASRTSRSSGLSTNSHLSSSLNDIRSLKSEGEDSLSQSDMAAENLDAKTLVTFMASLNLEQFTGTLVKESLDLNTLLLCSDEDLKSIGFPLGPRRKILDAVKKRTAVLNHPGPMTDSRI